MRRAFTLIELLIVVAIIGVLAAIAVPNFLNAQVRAKVARSLADMRSLSSAVHQIHLDKGFWLVDAWEDNGQEADGDRILLEIFNNVGACAEGSGGSTGYGRGTLEYIAPLTSPVAYMASIPMDPFVSDNIDAMTRGFGSPYNTYLYIDNDNHYEGPDHDIQCLHNAALAEYYHTRILRTNEFAFLALGPDGHLGVGSGGGALDSRGFPYSPSNGVASAGDIIMFGDAMIQK
jgi:prepilin-type N-terminal cleavage/methylation domain-containing protein